MRVTISKSSLNFSQKSRSSLQQQSSMFNKQQKSLWMSNQKKLHNKEKRQLEDSFCCDQGFFSKCLPSSNSKRIEDQSEVQLERPQQKAKFNQQLQSIKQQMNSRLRVISRVSKQQQRSIFPKNLEILRNVKIHQDKVRCVQLPVKQIQIEETKKNTEVYISRQASMLSSLSKKETSNRQIITEQCNFQPITISPKKLNITVSKKSKLFVQQCSQNCQKNLNEGFSTSKKQTKSIVFDANEILSKKNSFYYAEKNLHGSQSQFKIVDPLDEFKSINTQYLKKKIAFSSVQSQRQQLHNHIAQSIFYIKEKDDSFTKKEDQKQPRELYYSKEAKIENSIFSQSDQINSQQSVVLEKNFQRMFKFSVPTFSKIATSEETPNQNINSSKSYYKIQKIQ